MPKNRVDRLLRIWSLVEANFPDWELKVVGDGRERRNLEKEAAGLGLHRVRFCGHSTRVEEHYATAAILCLTSSFEGWGLVLVEAQAAGVVADCIRVFRRCPSYRGQRPQHGYSDRAPSTRRAMPKNWQS